MLTDVALKALNQKRTSTRLRTATACMFASCPVARSPFGWITGSTDAARRSILAGMDGTESRLPQPGEVSRREARYWRGTVAGDRKAARQAPSCHPDLRPTSAPKWLPNQSDARAFKASSYSGQAGPERRIHSHPLNLSAELPHRSHLSSRVRARTRAGAGGRIASCIRGSRRAGGCTRTSAVAGRGVTAGRTRAA